MKKYITTFLLLTGLFFTAFSNVSVHSKDAILGTWLNNGNTEQYIRFLDIGVFERIYYYDGPMEQAGHFSISNNRLILDGVEWAYSINGYILRMYDPFIEYPFVDYFVHEAAFREPLTLNEGLVGTWLLGFDNSIELTLNYDGTAETFLSDSAYWVSLDDVLLIKSRSTQPWDMSVIDISFFEINNNTLTLRAIRDEFETIYIRN